MKRSKRKHVMAGIDVGTTKICTTCAQAGEGFIEILGTGWAPSRGLKKGVVVNLSETIDSVRQSVEEAEKQSQAAVESAFVSIGGVFIRALNSTGETEVRGRGGEISEEDVDRAIGAATEVQMPEEYQVIHKLTRDFTVDGQNGIVNPIGMSGRNLSVSVHLVLNASPVVQNIVNAINKAGVLVDGVVMQQLASAEAVLSEDEKEIGTVLVDIGGGTSDLAVYSQGSIWHSEVLPMGGSMITKDIAIGLKIPLQEAEQLKREAGCVFPESVAEEELIEVSEVGSGLPRTLPRRRLCQIIQARCDEILHSVAEVVTRVGVQSDLVTGVVITGGGSLLDGLVDRAEQFLNMSVRVGYPMNVVSRDHPDFSPAYSTCLGLLSYAQDIQSRIPDGSQTFVNGRPLGAAERVRSWFLERIE